jgi:ferritin-like metal-binding protein YciE
MKLPSLNELLTDQLKDLYSAENQLLKALPKMVKAASDEALREAIASHLEETKGQVERLNRIGKSLGITLSGKKCAAMEGLLEEGKEVLEADGPDPILDLAMIAAAQRVEHYEISAYGSARALAEHLGHTDVAKLLQKTLDEESAADEKLTSVAADEIYPTVSEYDEEDEDVRPAKSNGRAKKPARAVAR